MTLTAPAYPYNLLHYSLGGLSLSILHFPSSPSRYERVVLGSYTCLVTFLSALLHLAAASSCCILAASAAAAAAASVAFARLAQPFPACQVYLAWRHVGCRRVISCLAGVPAPVCNPQHTGSDLLPTLETSLVPSRSVADPKTGIETRAASSAARAQIF